MYSFESTLAKTKPALPLYLHIEDCLALFNDVRSHKEQLVQRFCKQAGFSEEQFWQSAFLVVACHDLGKATVPFQDYLRSGKGRESHALISSWFVRQTCADFHWFEVKGKPVSVEALVVATHHSPLCQDLFQHDYAQNEADPKLLGRVIERLAKEIIGPGYRARFSKEKILTYSSPQSFKEVYESFNRDQAVARVLKRHEGIHLRTLFALLRSVLHYCDWYASGQCFDIDYAPQKIRQQVVAYLREEKGITFERWHHHQIRATGHEGHGLLQAPTGSGKTEASLLWADRNAHGRKVLYLLPTMTTTNRMRQRLQNTLKENVGIVHGTSEYLLVKEQDFENTWDYRRSLFAKTFITPCTVATVDQFLFPLFNWGRWELRLANAANTAIIFDEIHCYQPYTVALITEATKFFHELGAKLLFMSATFPQVLKDFLHQNLPLSEIPHDESLDTLCRVEIYLVDRELSQSVSQIVADYWAGKKVLVICDTVASSKELFQCLNEIPLPARMLFHSQFMLKHRHAKEDLLECLPPGGFVAVTTQVVEVSLDIDFDVLYTEDCPLDALIQRLGRVNRNGKRERAPVYLHHPMGNWRYVYDREIVSKSREAIACHAPLITEREFRKMVDNIYAEAGYDKRLREEQNKVKDLIDQVQGNCSYIYTLSAEEKNMQRLTTRESGYLSIDAIPIQFEDEVAALPNRIERVGYAVRVPVFRNRAYLDFREKGLVFVHAKDYDETFGVQFRSEDDIESRII